MSWFHWIYHKWAYLNDIFYNLNIKFCVCEYFFLFSRSLQVIIQMRLCRILCHGAFLRWNRFYVTMSNMNGIDSHDIGPDRTFRVNKSHVLFFFLFSFAVVIVVVGGAIQFVCFFHYFIFHVPFFPVVFFSPQRSLWLQQFRIIIGMPYVMFIYYSLLRWDCRVLSFSSFYLYLCYIFVFHNSISFALFSKTNTHTASWAHANRSFCGICKWNRAHSVMSCENSTHHF